MIDLYRTVEHLTDALTFLVRGVQVRQVSYPNYERVVAPEIWTIERVISDGLFRISRADGREETAHPNYLEKV